MLDASLELVRSDLIFLTNALNEVLNGFDIPNWEQQVCASRMDAEGLLKRLSAEIDSSAIDTVSVTLSQRELQLMIWSSDACANEFGAAEFQTRLGETLSHGRAISKRLAEAAES